MDIVEVESVTTDGRSEHQAGMEGGIYPAVPAEPPGGVDYISSNYAFEPVQGYQDMPMPDGRPIPGGRLFFVDFLPQFKEAGDMRKKIHPKFDGFQQLFNHVNNWIQSFPQYEAVSFEQISRPVDWTGQHLPLDTIYTSKELQRGNWLRGLRVWLTPRDANKPADSLGYYNAMPVSGVATSTDQFLDLQTTAAVHNEKLQAQPLPGRIIAILPVEMIVDSDWKPSQVIAGESGDDLYYMYEEPVRSLTFLRLIYAHGPPAMEQIGITDFPPRVIKLPSSGKGQPYMQPLQEVLNDMCSWIAENDNKTVRVVSVEISEAKFLNAVSHFQKLKDQKSTYDTSGSFFQASSDTTVIKIPRVCYVKLPGPTQEAPMALTTKLMVTPRIGYTEGEMMAQVVGRTNAWLSYTGNPVKVVQTARFEFDAPGNKVDVEASCHTLSKSLTYFIEVLVLFLHGGYAEPDPSLLPPTGKKIKSVDGTLKTGDYAKKSSSCTML